MRLWVRLFDEHELLTSASAIAPQIRPKVLPDVYAGIVATVDKIFSSSSWGLIVFASVLAVWEVSGAVRARMSALSKVDPVRPRPLARDRDLADIAFGVLVQWAPAERRPGRWASVGAALVVSAWIAQSLLFGWYVRSVASYGSAVGSLTAVYLFTTFLYVGAIVLLVAIELDAQLRRGVQGEEERNVLSIVGEVARRTRASGTG